VITRLDCGAVPSNVPATLTIEVKNFGIGAARHLSLPQSPGILELPFDSFGATDVFHQVGFIGLHFEIHGAGTFTIDRITAVPEPSALQLGLFAATGMGVFRRSSACGGCKEVNTRC
jgi:hypothetical protein